MLKVKNIPPGLLKNTLLVFTIILLVFHGELHWIVFKSFEFKYKKEVKQLIKAGIPENELIKMSFHKSIFQRSLPGFQWVKKGEFRYNGIMYDVIRKEEIKDSVYFYCFKDLKESGLFARLDEYLSGYMRNNPARQKEIINTLTGINSFYTAAASPDLPSAAERTEEYCGFYLFSTAGDYTGTNSPPPKS